LQAATAVRAASAAAKALVMIEVVLNDRLGKKIRVKCNEDDTVGDLKKLVAAQTGKHLQNVPNTIFACRTRPETHTCTQHTLSMHLVCDVHCFGTCGLLAY
jgi:hypothetical protein